MRGKSHHCQRDKSENADLYGTLKNVFADIEIEEIPHEEFKEKTKLSKAVIRTGEYRPYANIILQSGVTF
ncbi:MAG: RbsD/FucU domain-containing protein [[Clostridium] scindens]